MKGWQAPERPQRQTQATLDEKGEGGMQDDTAEVLKLFPLQLLKGEVLTTATPKQFAIKRTL